MKNTKTEKKITHQGCCLRLGPVYMEWGTPVWWGKFLLFCVPQSVKTKETNPTRPGSPTPCKQALRVLAFQTKTRHIITAIFMPLFLAILVVYIFD